MKHVLSIDGGGIRGLIPAMVLAEIERQAGKPISQLFDLVAGTSTGGILALGLCMNDGTGAPQYSAEDLVEIYENRGAEIFNTSLWKNITSSAGLSDEKYSEAGLESVLDDYFQNELFGSSLKKVLITTYDIHNRVPLFFKSWKQKHAQVMSKHIARATSAAPTFFEPAQVTVDGAVQTLIDGGIFINNPSVSAWAEANRIFPGEEVRVVSIGTGELVRPIPYEKAKDWGKVGWMIPVLSCIFDGVSDAADYQMNEILGKNYIRLQTSLSIASDDMDDASDENIDLLIQEAEKLIEVNAEAIAKLF